MKLQEWSEAANDFTEKLSDVNRSLSFAGIAVIWIFKYTNGGQTSIPKELYIPLLLFVASLGFDLLQYIYGTFILMWFVRKHEKLKEIDPNKEEYVKDEIVADPRMSIGPYYYFLLPKVILTVVGFSFLLIYLFKTIF